MCVEGGGGRRRRGGGENLGFRCCDRTLRLKHPGTPLLKTRRRATGHGRSASCLSSSPTPAGLYVRSSKEAIASVLLTIEIQCQSLAAVSWRSERSGLLRLPEFCGGRPLLLFCGLPLPLWLSSLW